MTGRTWPRGQGLTTPGICCICLQLHAEGFFELIQPLVPPPPPDPAPNQSPDSSDWPGVTSAGPVAVCWHSVCPLSLSAASWACCLCLKRLWAWPDSTQLPIRAKLCPQVCVFFRRLRFCHFDLKGQNVRLVPPPTRRQEVELRRSSCRLHLSGMNGSDHRGNCKLHVEKRKVSSSTCQLVALWLPLEVCFVSPSAP